MEVRRVKLSIEDGRLKVRLSLLNRVLALRGSVSVPLEDIESCNTGDPRWGWLDIRAPGTLLPFLVRTGTYFTRRGREFWYVTRYRNYLIVELKRGFYKRLIVSVDDNKGWEQRINRDVASYA